MKILYVSPVGGLGGAERCLLTTMRAAQRAGHDVHLLACTDGPLLAHAAALGIPARLLPMPPAMAATGESGGALRALCRAPLLWLATRRYARDLARAAADIAPEVIHSNGLKTHLLLSAARPAAPVVWHLHDFLASRRLARILLRRARPRAARAIAISRAVRDDAAPVLSPLPIDTVLNAIDVTHFSPAPARTDDVLGHLPGDPAALRVGLVATYARWKGHDCFLRAAARVLRDRPNADVRFYLVGGPIYHTAGSQWSESELDALANDLGIASHVTRVPFQPDTAAVYRALDVVVHASTRPEPFGLTIVEAMACARPVIVAAAGGATEIATHDTDALTFPPNDDTALSACITALIDSPPTRARLATAARTTATTRFSDHRLATELSAVYRRAASRS